MTQKISRKNNRKREKRLYATHNTSKHSEELKAKIAQSLENNCVHLDADSHDNMLKMVEECTEEALKHPLDSLQHDSKSCNVLIKKTTFNKDGTPS